MGMADGHEPFEWNETERKACSARLEEMLSAREAEQPGFRKAWEMALAASEAKRQETESKKLEEYKAIVDGLERMGRNLPSGAAEAFSACMKNSLSSPLPLLARNYRDASIARNEARKAPGRSVVAVREEWEAIGNAALELQRMLKNLSSKARDEVSLAKEIAHRCEDRDLQEAVRGADVILSLPPLLRSLGNFSGALVNKLDEVVRDGAKDDWEDGHSSSPDEVLHLEIVRILRDNSITDRWLGHIARVVRAWALGETSTINIPDTWGKEARTKARNWWKVQDTAMVQCAKVILRNWRHIFAKSQFVNRGRGARIKH